MPSLNVPHYEQELPYSCLPPCARMVLAYHGVMLSEQELRQHLGTGVQGTVARDLFLLAPLGFLVRIQPLSLTQLEASLTAGDPPIVFLETSYLGYWSLRCDHVAVVVETNPTAVILNDPAFPSPQQTSLGNFKAAWASNYKIVAIIRPKP